MGWYQQCQINVEADLDWEKGAVTRQKYDDIVKDQAAASLYINWTYYWQIASGDQKLKQPQIWAQYVKLLDAIYQWMFE